MTSGSQLVIIAGWALSIIALIGTIIAVVIINGRRKQGDSPISAWLGYTVGIYVTAFFMLLSQEIVGLAGSVGSPILLDTVLGCMQMLGTGRDISLDVGVLAWMGSALPLYIIYNASLFVAAPVGTLGTIISVASNLFGVPMVKWLAKTHDVYVISNLNEQSLALGKSIIEKGRQLNSNKLVVYANVENPKASIASDARMAGARCLLQAMEFIAPRIKGSQIHERAFVLAGEDEVKNLGEGIELAKSLAEWSEQGNKAPHVLVFSSSPVAGPTIDAATQEINASEDGVKVKVRLRRVDWVRSAVDTLLDSYPLFATGLDGEHMRDEEYQTKLRFDYDVDTRRILIVGKTPFAKEFLKGALWASQLGDEIRTQIDMTAVGIEGFVSRFKLECPEFFADEDHPYHGHYNLRFLPVDPEGAGYASLLQETSEFGEYTHVFIALENDLVCAKVARRTRELLEQKRLKDGPFNPAFIAAVINNAELAQTVRAMKARGRSYAITPVGDDAVVYSYDSIFNPALLRQAQNVNRAYCRYLFEDKTGSEFKQAMERADVDLVKSEYNLRSSVASALHRKYALFLVCRKTKSVAGAAVDWTRSLEEIDSSVLEEYDNYIASGEAKWLARVEHDRWSAYVSTEGHAFIPISYVEEIEKMEGRHNYELAHLHPCLTSFDGLLDLDDELKSIGIDKPPYQTVDDDVIRGIKAIVASDDDFETEWKKYFD